jgi:hypothetical protein
VRLPDDPLLLGADGEPIHTSRNVVKQEKIASSTRWPDQVRPWRFL